MKSFLFIKLSLGRPALVALAIVALAGTGHAQITWGAPSSITGVSNIATNGTYFDAIKASTVAATADQTIGDTTFNIINSGGTEVNGPGFITLSNLAATNGGDGNFTSAPPSSPAYSNILQGVSYVIGGNPAGTITLSGLTSGNVYQVEVWDATSSSNSENDSSLLSGVNPVQLTQSEFVVGTFTASGAMQSFNFSVPLYTSTNYAGLSAVAVRDLTETPEPSTYAMMLLAGVVLLAAVNRRRLRA